MCPVDYHCSYKPLFGDTPVAPRDLRPESLVYGFRVMFLAQGAPRNGYIRSAFLPQRPKGCEKQD